MRHLLDKYSDVISDHSRAFHHHQSESQLRELFSTSGWDASQYVMFANVRNPWGRAFSAHNYRLKVAGEPAEQHPDPVFYRRCREYAEAEISFSEAVSDLVLQMRSQSSFLLSREKTLVRAVRLEFLSEELRPLWMELGLDMSDLDDIPLLNPSSKGNYVDHYTKEAIEIVAECFADDINRFGYSFDSGL